MYPPPSITQNTAARHQRQTYASTSLLTASLSAATRMVTAVANSIAARRAMARIGETAIKSLATNASSHQTRHHLALAPARASRYASTSLLTASLSAATRMMAAVANSIAARRAMARIGETAIKSLATNASSHQTR